MCLMANLSNNQIRRAVEDAFNSMLRTDYIPLADTQKLKNLSKYYVDYLNFLRDIVSETDHLVIGRRGTGKTTLLYRGLVECINSWGRDICLSKPKTLAIYLDLSKCHSLADTSSNDYSEFEHAFASELCDAIRVELNRTWPELEENEGIFNKLFQPDATRAKQETKEAIDKLSLILRRGILRRDDASGKRTDTLEEESQSVYKQEISLQLSPTEQKSALTAQREKGDKERQKTEGERAVTYRLQISDIIRALAEIRRAAGISHFVILIDEFSSLSNELQRRFSSLARKILGNQAGVFLKICAITDNYTLGSSIILQRDLFELNLDLDSYVERSGTLGTAMRGLETLTGKLIRERLIAYGVSNTEMIFEDISSALTEISRAAMGVPRTVGIILKQALSRAIGEDRVGIRRSDIDYGIKYAARAYYNQFSGTCGVSLPMHYLDMWNALLDRAISEREKKDSSTSHFMVLGSNEPKLKYFNMFFLVHLLTQGRTTKKDKSTRSLYCFDYGTCIENNMVWGDDKNVIRQQRFAYDDVFIPFDSHFRSNTSSRWSCVSCGAIYEDKDLNVAGHKLDFCPKDRSDLVRMKQDEFGSFTEEEAKIIGAIRSSTEMDSLQARQVADDVGCYVQKVAKFGEKLNREGLIGRSKQNDRYIYFQPS